VKNRRGLRRRAALVAAMAVLGVALFSAIGADYPAPPWFVALAVAGMVLAFGGVVVLVVDAIRIRAGRIGYFFPDRPLPGDAIPDELAERIRPPGWLTTFSTVILVCVAGTLFDRYRAPWWLDISAYGALIGCSLVVEGTIWSAYCRLRTRLATRAQANHE
jgi:hypothetical protein